MTSHCLDGPKSAPNSVQGKAENFRLVINGEYTADAHFTQCRHRTANEEHVKHLMPDAVKVGTELIAEVDRAKFVEIEQTAKVGTEL